MRTFRFTGAAGVLLALLLCAACGEERSESVRPAPALADTIAVNTHYGNGAPVDRAALARLRVAGVRMIRNDLDWAHSERERGVYDFEGSGIDTLVYAAEAENLRILFILDYGNPLYDRHKAVVDDAGRAAFAAFAGAAARRYRGRQCLWEIWNEPNLGTFWGGGGVRPDPETYARLVEVVAPAIHAADPSATVLIGAVYTGLPDLVPLISGIPGLEFFERLFATGVLAKGDAVTAHFYRAEPPETVVETVDAIRALMAAAARPLPLWSGEWGYSTYDPNAPATNINPLPAVSLDRQASYAARMMLNNFRLGLVASVWFKDRDSKNPDPGDSEQHWGLMNDDLSPKPSYDAIATLSRLAGDGHLAGALELGDGRYGLTFDTPRGHVTALWALEPVTWSLRFEATGAQVLGRDGRDLTAVVLANPVLTIQPDEGPIYLIGDVTAFAAH